MRIALSLAALLVIASGLRAEIPWNADLKVAHQQAQAEGKLLLVHFESDNCVWCDRLEAGAFQSPDVAAVIGQAYVPVKINASKNKKLAEYFKVNRFPTDVVVDASGAVHAHNVSPQAPLQYITMLQEAAAKGGRPIGPAGANIAQQAPSPSQLQTPVVAQPPAAQPPAAAMAHQPMPAAENPPTAANAAGGFGMPPAAAGNFAANAPAGQFQLPSHSPLQAPSVSPVSAAITMPPSKPIQQNDGGAATMAANEFAIAPQPKAPAADPTSEAVSPPATPPLAMDGYCPVAILDESRWVSGDKQFGAIHLGKLYLFGSAQSQAKFLADPEKYTPALGGMDVVKFFENQEQVEGNREFGLHHQGQLFFFTSEDSLKRFFQSPESYSVKAQDVMHQAVSQVRQLH
ncbi:YHS domain protein [Rosistilla carotiformis]|uniref:YHS domain protein n=1 Tax=Rosistilla carotiformis TaxID=2528017 RepID=A0A518JQN8_9BACT|nr:thioredoxin family protein [Rosistilla carotiformis]QDV67852.1 YHS domain protein [Rosistilla carotiformis]